MPTKKETARKKLLGEIHEVIKLNIKGESSGVVLEIINEWEELREIIVPSLKVELEKGMKLNKDLSEKVARLNETLDEWNQREADLRGREVDLIAAVEVLKLDRLKIEEEKRDQRVFEAETNLKAAERRADDIMKLTAIAFNAHTIVAPTRGQKDLENGK